MLDAQKDRAKELLDPAIKGTTSLLHSAVEEPQIKAVVITSSFVACSRIETHTDMRSLPESLRLWTSGSSRGRANHTLNETGTA